MMYLINTNMHTYIQNIFILTCSKEEVLPGRTQHMLLIATFISVYANLGNYVQVFVCTIIIIISCHKHSKKSVAR